MEGRNRRPWGPEGYDAIMSAEENSLDYQRGYRDAQGDMRADLANVLRLHSVGEGTHDEELLSDAKVREIFTAVFGAMATVEEFGEEPTGRFDIRRLFGDEEP